MCSLSFSKIIAGYFELKTSTKCLVKNKRQQEVLKNVIYDLMTD